MPLPVLDHMRDHRAACVDHLARLVTARDECLRRAAEFEALITEGRALLVELDRLIEMRQKDRR